MYVSEIISVQLQVQKKQDLSSWPKSQPCIDDVAVFVSDKVYNQSVVNVKTIFSRSLHDVLLTLIILWWIFFMS